MLEQFFFIVFTLAVFAVGYYLGNVYDNYEDGYVDGYRDGYCDANRQKFEEQKDDLRKHKDD